MEKENEIEEQVPELNGVKFQVSEKVVVDKHETISLDILSSLKICGKALLINKLRLKQKVSESPQYNICNRSKYVFSVYPDLLETMIKNCVSSEGVDYSDKIREILKFSIYQPNLLFVDTKETYITLDFLKNDIKHFLMDEKINLIIKEYVCLIMLNFLNRYYKITIDAIDSKNLKNIIIVGRDMRKNYTRFHKLLGVLREIRNGR